MLNIKSLLMLQLVYDEIFPDLSIYADINAVILPVISDSSIFIRK